MTHEFLTPSLAIALSAYAVGVISPGPSNMAIMATAMAQGRMKALTLACGVIGGSLTWGLAAAFGLATIMQTYTWMLLAIKILGGSYMLYLAWKAGAAAMQTHAPELSPRVDQQSGWKTCLQGFAMHLTNPKAIFVWLSIVALALKPGANREDAIKVVASCGIVGASVFTTYALAFSTVTARTLYLRCHRWFNATLCATFALAGAKLLLTRDPH